MIISSEKEQRWQNGLADWRQQVEKYHRDFPMLIGVHGDLTSIPSLLKMRRYEKKYARRELRGFSTEHALDVSYDDDFRKLLRGGSVDDLLKEISGRGGLPICADIMGFGRVYRGKQIGRALGVALSNPYELPVAEKWELMDDKCFHFETYSYRRIIDSRPLSLKPKQSEQSECAASFSPSRDSKIDLVVGNILSNRTWKAVETWLEGKKFDLIMCGPVLHVSEKPTDKFEHPDLYYYLLSHQYELLSSNGGTLLTATRGEARELVIQWMYEATEHGIEVDMEFGRLIRDQDTLMVVKNSESPEKAPTVKYKGEIPAVFRGSL